jgi:mRNA interferase RelE/StbE
MRLALTNRFRRAYGELTNEEQALADKALRLLVENLRHPSLRVKRIKATEGIWEARVSRSMRLTFEVHGDLLVLRNIGRHDEALGRP